MAVENVETVLGAAPLVAQIFIHGESTEDFVVGVVVVDAAAYESAHGTMNLPPKLHDALGHPESSSRLCAEVLAQVDAVGRKMGLKGFELPRAIHLESSPWLPDDAAAIVTPTLKLKRIGARKKYHDVLSRLYKQRKQPKSKL